MRKYLHAAGIVILGIAYFLTFIAGALILVYLLHSCVTS